MAETRHGGTGPKIARAASATKQNGISNPTAAWRASPGITPLAKLPRYFPAASWSTGLKLTSALGTIAILAAGLAAYRVIPTPAGFTGLFGLGTAVVLLGILVASLVFMVAGYTVTDRELRVKRPLWSTRISLAGLSRVWFEPAACNGSIRLFGNGGLFSFTGLYRHHALGSYRLFATNFSQSVILALPLRVVVITPAAPQAFIEHLCRLIPTVRGGPNDGGA